ncbi:MAG: hypothetical protein QOD94_90 [Alphaproteobacteria bacterium]|jgi:hypothetical protein|nr:hypothetical protein [Alphaproteobacteria bacterium]
MPPIRLTAAAAAVVVLAFAPSPATALPCNGDDAGCVEVESEQASPMKLDTFMKTWKPVAKAKRAKKTKSARKPAVKEIASKPAVAETAPRPAPQSIAAKPEQSMETDEVGVTSSNEVDVEVTSSNEPETDGVASQVQVVAFNQVNEVDLAAPVAPAPAETFGQSVSAEQPAADTSWMELLLVLAGTLALASATRLLTA